MVAFTWAPRPFYVCYAQHDLWTDPVGQWIGASEAAPVHELYSLDVAFTSSTPPAVKTGPCEHSIQVESKPLISSKSESG